MIQLLSLRQIKGRIRSVESTKKITHAMEMISASKLKNAEKALVAAKPYAAKLATITGELLATRPDLSHPLFEEHANGRAILLIVVTADTGLCGGYNHALLSLADDFMVKRPGRAFRVVAVGKRAAVYFKQRHVPIDHAYTELHGRFSASACTAITRHAIDKFMTDEIDEAHVIYTVFHSASKLVPIREEILPVVPPTDGIRREYLFEPEPQALLDRLIPEYLEKKMKIVLLNAFVSEHSARLVAMSKATENASELLENLILSRNKVRQANITKEMLEIISSAEALKG